MFVTSVGGWVTADDNINLAAEATYAVNATAGSTVTLPELNIAEGTKGKVDWGDGTIESYSNEGTKSSVADDKITFSHTYASAFEGDMMIIVEEGKISGEISAAEFSKFAVLNSEKVNITKPIVFTVNDSGKTVKFSPGNLYWDGTQFKFEAHQYDYPSTRESGHIGHFFWSKDARVAYAADYDAANTEFGITPAVDDKFFAEDGGAIEGYTVLSSTEWDYLIANAIAKNSSSKNTIVINGKNCAVLKPDGFIGTVTDSYSVEEWATAESTYGLVALPFVGGYYGSSVYDADFNGCYWSFSPFRDRGADDVVDEDDAVDAYFGSDNAETNFNYRLSGYSVRLVSVQ